jgi:hypothetical protein
MPTALNDVRAIDRATAQVFPVLTALNSLLQQ